MGYLIGTSGFSYDDWISTFYPEQQNKNTMLSYYAGVFKTVEINVTYYTIPTASSFEKMCAKTSEDFMFMVKTNRETTHNRKENKKSIGMLLDSVKPLIEKNQLAGFLAQFPYSFHNREENRRYLLQTKEFTKEIPLFVEFRNDSWVNDALPVFLYKNQIGYVNVDEPMLKGLLPAQSLVTNDYGYIRFHGRNEKLWWDGQGSERYEYNYSNEQLQEWLIRISEVLKKSYKTYIFFNNHPKGNAPKNAQTLQKMIEQYIGN